MVPKLVNPGTGRRAVSGLLAQALSKPLTARLMPIPGLKAGESTHFDFPYLVNGQTLPLEWSGSAMRQESLAGWIS